MDERECDGDQYRGPKSHPCRAGDKGDCAGGEGGAKHFAFEPDIKDARALGIKASKAGEKEWRGEAQAAVEDLEDGGDIHALTLQCQFQASAGEHRAERSFHVAARAQVAASDGW